MGLPTESLVDVQFRQCISFVSIRRDICNAEQISIPLKAVLGVSLALSESQVVLRRCLRLQCLPDLFPEALVPGPPGP